tara:strand:- start:258 stop:446 length:189 start_codon:yes stop_codon:yes gene_type:complete
MSGAKTPGNSVAKLAAVYGPHQSPGSLGRSAGRNTTSIRAMGALDEAKDPQLLKLEQALGMS